MPGRQSFVVEMVGYEDLANAIALNSMMFNSARMLGPPLAGLLIAWLGTGTCFFLNGLSFLAVIWSLWQMKIVPRSIDLGRARDVLSQTSRRARLRMASSAYLSQMVLAAVTNGFGYQYLVLVPIFARNVLHGDAKHLRFSGRDSGTGLGARRGDAGLARYLRAESQQSDRRGCSSPRQGIITFGLSPWLGLSLIAQLVIGAGLTNFRASNNTLVQLFVSDDLRGRVMSTYQLAAVGMMPLGALTVGYHGHAAGAAHTVVICGAVTLVCAIVLLTGLKSIGGAQADPD